MFNGNYKKNPFNFNVSSVTVTVNDEAIPFRSIKLSFGANKRYIEAFLTQFSGTGKLFYDRRNGISRDEFSAGYCIYAFDLSPDMCGGSVHLNRVHKGNLSLEIQF